MKKSTLTFLGRDSGFGRENNSVYVEIDDKLVIIDCGFTVFEKLIEKLKLEEYKEIDVIITHLHNDHAGSLSQLILYLYFIYNKKVNIISKCEKMKEYLEITGTPEEAYTLQGEKEYVEIIKTEHTKYLDAYGCKLTIKGKTIIYTGETNTLEPYRPYLKSADELYVDVSKFRRSAFKNRQYHRRIKKRKKQWNRYLFNAYG